MVKVKEDLTGRKFGKLTVLYQAEDYVNPSEHHSAMWHCLCECGKEKNIHQCSLKNGDTTSCGCNNGQWSKKYNTYVDCDDYYIGLDVNNKEFIIDKEDYDLVKDYCWNIDKHGYAKTIINSKKYYLHRMIMECSTNDNIIVDHIDRDRTNNRKNNLRIVSASNNVINQTKRSDNKSGIIGVCWNKSREYWEAYIKYGKKKTHLGAFKNIEDAIITRLKAEKELFGEYAPQKHLYKKYDIN